MFFDLVGEESDRLDLRSLNQASALICFNGQAAARLYYTTRDSVSW